MERLVIKGGKPLYGEVRISGAKNAALPILAATLLATGKYHIGNVPYLRDVSTMNSLLGTLGVECVHNNGSIDICNTGLCGSCEASYELVKTMRASILVLGPMLSRTGRAKVALPGGCAIGERPVNYHIAALEKMGAKIEVSGGYINASCQKLKGAEIVFDKVTVTGTENLLMAAAIADGVTVLQNAAREPEVRDLAGFLRAMGADIEGDGTTTIIVRGVKELHAADYRVMPDRIEAGTFLCAVAGCGGKIIIHDCPIATMGAVIEKLKAAGLKIKIIDDFTVEAESSGIIKAVDVETFPYPGFPTDMQSQFMAVMLKADGVSVITESIFENRFMHVPEFKRMGADVSLSDSNAIVKGCSNFSGAPVMASDLRASAGLVIAALMADNSSEIQRIYHLDRGYEGFERKLSALGADIRRIRSEK
ncbi:MAG: UDP-N-acetylglucosamine 1-carboxyvinyltransferase [Deferribacterales bacterium]|nr:UDP-N-acetylglucosamine 1-carboxyvinyltransferase [Deferribacterales bacterium]